MTWELVGMIGAYTLLVCIVLIVVGALISTIYAAKTKRELELFSAGLMPKNSTLVRRDDVQ